MKPPLPPELVRLGDELERDVRERVVHRPRRRQLALNVMASFVITVPVVVGIVGAELARPVAEPDAAPPAPPPPTVIAPRTAISFYDSLPYDLRRAASLSGVPSPPQLEPAPLRPELR